MRCRTFFARSLSFGGCLVFLTHPLPAVTDLPSTYDAAKKQRDWSTAAETAIRSLEKDPSQHTLFGGIAEARLHQNDLEDCAKWLARWEATVDQPTAEMHALRGELALSNQNLREARSYWEKSYELAPSQNVARRLTDPDLWKEDERPAYESLMVNVASSYPLTQALKIASEAAIRNRDWAHCQERVNTLNELGTQSGMSTAAALEAILEQRQLLAQHDAHLTEKESGLGYARRANFFREHQILQLAIEDARKALAEAEKAGTVTLAQLKDELGI